MYINCDLIFIEALQKAGYDIDYKKITEIYKESRKHPVVVKRKAHNAWLNAAINSDLFDGSEKKKK